MCDELSCTPPELRDIIENGINDLLPGKSKTKYEHCYQNFQEWCKINNVSGISENILFAYFNELKRKYKPTTLWNTYSMLKSCLNIFKNVDISKYNKLQAFLKRSSEGYIPKKSKILEEENIQEFLNKADDKFYLAMKVILIVGYNGACRREELTNLSVDDIEFKPDCIIVTLPNTKNRIPRTFAITEPSWIELVKKYANLRPKKVTHKRFFLTYRNGKCVNSPIGINIMGGISKKIASFLQLPNPELFTGHCFRRSSATHLVNRGGDLITLKRFGGWKSSAVAEGYIETSLKNKIDISEKLTRPNNNPGCSKDSEVNQSITICDTTNIQKDIRTNNLPGITINSSDTSNVVVNIYNSCSFGGNNSK